MDSYPASRLASFDVRRLLPTENPDSRDRAEAWGACWEAISRAVLKYIRCKNGTSADDREILADSMVIAYMEVEGGRYQHRADVPFTAYVKGIARNMIRDAYRRDRRHVPLEAGANHVADDVDIALESAHQRDKFRRCTEDLTPRRRMVLMLYSEGYSTAQIAERLGISTDLVRQEKARAIQRLRKLLNQ